MLRRFAVLMLAGVITLTQSWAQSAEFEVASVKPSNSLEQGATIRTPFGGRFAAENISLQFLIRLAYHVTDRQITGGPGWIDSAKFDVLAKAEGNPTFEQISPLLRSLLEDRFTLKLHRETKELPVYALVIAKNGSGLQNPENCTPCYGITMRKGRIEADKTNMPELARILTEVLGRPVLDKTGMASSFQVHLQWAPDEVVSDAPSLFTAVQDRTQFNPQEFSKLLQEFAHVATPKK